MDNKKEIQELFSEANKPLENKIADMEARLAEDSANVALKAELDAAKKESAEMKADFDKKIADLTAKFAEAQTKAFDSAAADSEKGKKFAQEWVHEVLSTKVGNVHTFDERVKQVCAKFALTDGQNITNNGDGGYLVPTELADEIMKKTINEIAPVLGLTRRFPMGENLTINTRVGIPSARRDGEGDAAIDGKSTYLPVTLTAERLSVTVPATWEYLNFTKGDATSRITEDVSEAYAAKYLWELFNGVSSNKQMEGVLTNAAVIAGATQTESVGAIGYEDLIDLESSVKTNNSANLRYFMDRRTLGAVRKLQDGAGNYIFTPGTAEKPSTINGIPVMLTGTVTVHDGSTIGEKQVMPLIAEGAYPILLADFSGYAFGDAKGMTLMFDDKTGASSATFYWNFHAWNDGVVALPEKFKLLKIKAATSS